MRRWWEEVVIDLYDRVDGFVYAAHKGRLDDEEHELAVSDALMRISTRLLFTFRGSSMGELLGAVATLCRHVCMDVQRREKVRRRHERLELDAGRRLNGEELVGERSLAEVEEAVRRHEEAERQRDLEDFFAWALPQLNGKRRQVLRMTLDGVPIEKIAAALETTRDNAYQLRSRGIRDLGKLKERYDR